MASHRPSGRSAECFDFERMVCITEIEGVLVNEEALHIGTAAVEAQKGVDNPVERGCPPEAKDVARRVPYIPGSSLKGVLRSTAERLVRSGLLGEGRWVCNPFSREDKRREDREGPCVICQIFGGGGERENRIASHVMVYDAFPQDPDSVRVRTRTRVAISRLKGGAAGGRLFSVELVEPGTRWRFRMRIINIDLEDEEDERAKVLRELLKLLRKGLIHVGGGRSVGLGRVKLEEAEVSIYEIKDGALKEREKEDLDIVIGLRRS